VKPTDLQRVSFATWQTGRVASPRRPALGKFRATNPVGPLGDRTLPGPALPVELNEDGSEGNANAAVRCQYAQEGLNQCCAEQDADP